ncbi:MAG: type II 3-dehydroquinate dehydratase [Caldilineaceae bacterium SB0662_bin_9]|uniref:3-dehydroquinate dehydratase n=1 Tax=Caldilineaceae bacterium SB0662_bin_9 TaxID=2605258 RepID=A0A6B1DX72_9CHLR|nr:type II 3-dehydroquinate dehydratase [Caldilineaceae bacterium]MYD91252.1 type II 3-dehydroquinate dehydratase [Caldilineaceae bacterium SB0662_bin_9]
MARIQIVNGPNLNLLGTRETSIYGTFTLADVERSLTAEFGERHSLGFFQSNHEGEIVDELHRCRSQADGVVLNPGAFTHYSLAIHDAIKAIETPVVEVHISNIHARDSFRHTSVLVAACLGQVSGFGRNSYHLAVSALERHLQATD